MVAYAYADIHRLMEGEGKMSNACVMRFTEVGDSFGDSALLSCVSRKSFILCTYRRLFGISTRLMESVKVGARVI